MITRANENFDHMIQSTRSRHLRFAVKRMEVKVSPPAARSTVPRGALRPGGDAVRWIQSSKSRNFLVSAGTHGTRTRLGTPGNFGCLGVTNRPLAINDRFRLNRRVPRRLPLDTYTYLSLSPPQGRRSPSVMAHHPHGFEWSGPARIQDGGISNLPPTYRVSIRTQTRFEFEGSSLRV